MDTAPSARQERAQSNASHRSDTSNSHKARRSREQSRQRPSVAANTSNTSPALDPDFVAEVTKHVLASLKASHTESDSPEARPISRQSTWPRRPLTPPLNESQGNTRSRVSPKMPNTNRRGRYTPPSCESGVSSPEPMSDSAAQSASATAARQQRQARPSIPSSPERERLDSRPKSRASNDADSLLASDEALLEKIWQPLFDADSCPTPRLGLFLRGLAKHIIDDFEPKNSIVIPPSKLVTLFEKTSVTNEAFSWKTLFGGKLPNAAISKLYRDLRCQHHLIQSNPWDLPTTPGLTPSGLETFLTTLIQANPDQEYQRFAIAVRDMPINNAEDIKERFPKRLVRRLFPAQVILQKQQQLVAAVSAADSTFQLDGYHMPPPPPLSSRPQERSNAKTKPPSSTYREPELPKAEGPKIERARRPYTAQEGQGKQYEDIKKSKSDRPSTSKTAATPTTRVSRSTSVTPIPEKDPVARSRPADSSSSRRSKRKSMYGACTGIPARYGEGTAAQGEANNFAHEQPMLGSSLPRATAVPTFPPPSMTPDPQYQSPYMAQDLHSSMEFPRRPLRRSNEEGRGFSSNLRASNHDGYGK